MSWLVIILLGLGAMVSLLAILLAVCLYFYVGALREAYEEGWDMPN